MIGTSDPRLPPLAALIVSLYPYDDEHLSMSTLDSLAWPFTKGETTEATSVVDRLSIYGRVRTEP